MEKKDYFLTSEIVNRFKGDKSKREKFSLLISIYHNTKNGRIPFYMVGGIKMVWCPAKYKTYYEWKTGWNEAFKAKPVK